MMKTYREESNADDALDVQNDAAWAAHMAGFFGQDFGDKEEGPAVPRVKPQGDSTPNAPGRGDSRAKTLEDQIAEAVNTRMNASEGPGYGSVQISEAARVADAAAQNEFERGLHDFDAIAKRTTRSTFGSTVTTRGYR